MWKELKGTTECAIRIGHHTVEEFRAAAISDAQAWKTNSKSKANSGSVKLFREVFQTKGMAVWVYLHERYMTCSDCSFDFFEEFVPLTNITNHSDVVLTNSCRQNDHYMIKLIIPA